MSGSPLCRNCGSEDIAAYRLAKRTYICRSCDAAEQRAYWARRGAEGRARPSRKAKAAVQARADAKQYADPIGRMKKRAQAAARYAIKSGRLQRLPCEVCGVTPTEAHHDDYSQPLNVRWLCPTHHREHHAAERAVRCAA